MTHRVVSAILLERNQNNRALGETLEDGFLLRNNPLEGRAPGYIYSGSALVVEAIRKAHAFQAADKLLWLVLCLWPDFRAVLQFMWRFQSRAGWLFLKEKAT